MYLGAQAHPRHSAQRRRDGRPTWLLLATGLLDLPGATATGALRLSGSRAGEVASLLPLVKID